MTGGKMKSMTGYGAAEGMVGGGRVFIEIKSVNHRYCDITLKIPPKMNALDPLLRNAVKRSVERGKIELFLKERRGIAESKDISIDIPLARKYQRCLKQLERELGPFKKDIHLLEAIDAKELILIEDVGADYSRYWGAIEKIAWAALKKLDVMRAREGSHLLADQKKRLHKIERLTSEISARASLSARQNGQKVRDKFAQMGGQVPQDRVDAEVASVIDKIDVAEELTRLGSHIKQYRLIIQEKAGVGRQLDFLLQEMNREINTIGSKACDAQVSNCVVFVKTELEKLREQVQNIE
jgi:uncharacterized protein (TIGR00255 family)